MIELAPICIQAARGYFEKYSAYRGEFNIAICAKEGEAVVGVIALVADGAKFKLGHIWTDGSAQAGSLLYGGAWRAAKALGYKAIEI